MKKIITICAAILMTATVFAQAPQKMSYQAVIRDGSNALVTSTAVSMQISILQGNANGTAVYVETQNAATNTNGLVSIEIGGGTVTVGSFAAIDWANGPYFIKTETDPAGGTNYTITGTTQLLSVPYALFSANGFPSGGANGQVLTMCNGIPTWTTGGQCPSAAGSITALNCGSATNNGTLISGTSASGISSLVPYTGGNGGTHNGQTVTSTGVTGLTATLAAGAFANGIGSLTYTISGTPSASGTASFALSIGGQSCTLTRTAGLPAGIITALNCGSATNNGTLTSGTVASGVSSLVPYTGGNGGTHNGQTVTSTGVIGLTATLAAGTFANGAGSLTYTISGTPSASGTASFALNIGGQSCSLTRTVGLPVGSITSLNCGSATNNGTLTSGTVASGVSSLVPYTGGNGGTHNGQTVNSTSVSGLTATLAAGTFANGAGSLTYTISGTPSTSGTASFALNIGAQSCTLSINVLTASSPAYPSNSLFCANGPTSVVEVTNPTTGRIWMDRNLGATQAATSSTDTNSYGDLYQWGRRSDGHQCRTSATTNTLSSSDQPAHGNFILAPSSPNDWRSPQNDLLWQGVSGLNNPCPIGFRLATEAELNEERLSWSNNNGAGAFGSPLKLPVAGYRFNNGTVVVVGSTGSYWSSTINGTNSIDLGFNSSGGAVMGSYGRAYASSVRCIKD